MSLRVDQDIERNQQDHSDDKVVSASSNVSSSSGSTESLEEVKAQALDEPPVPKQIPLTDKKGNKVTRYIRYNFYTTYRKIFTFIFTVNLIVFVILVARARGTPKTTNVANAASANLMACILFRQENFVNVLYEVFSCVPHSVPLAIRRRLAKIYHYGGGHSGSGVAAVVWYILYTALNTIDFVQAPSRDSRASVATSYIVLTMFIFILAAAWPRFRVKFHDRFEATHRLAGWTALCCFWIHNIVYANARRKVEDISLGLYLVRSPNFWFICVSTSCTLISWSRLRRREVFPEVLSDHAIRLHFKYKAMQPFYGVKVSTNPVLEWHAFATIPDEDENGKINGFSVVVSNAGDWTRQSINSPPKKVWIRGYPLHGVLYTSRLFKRIVVVATGSGIGPCLSLFYANITPTRVLWSTQTPEQTYGTKIIDAVRKVDKNAVIWNTRQLGRPDIVALTYQLVKESDAEAVFIISNPKVTHKVVYGMETRGIAAYGAIFDS